MVSEGGATCVDSEERGCVSWRRGSVICGADSMMLKIRCSETVGMMRFWLCYCDSDMLLP